MDKQTGGGNDMFVFPQSCGNGFGGIRQASFEVVGECTNIECISKRGENCFIRWSHVGKQKNPKKTQKKSAVIEVLTVVEKSSVRRVFRSLRGRVLWC